MATYKLFRVKVNKNRVLRFVDIEVKQWLKVVGGIDDIKDINELNDERILYKYSDTSVER